MTTIRQLIQKLWSYCQVLRDDGVSTLDYLQQITFLLFLKMADEQSKAPWNRPSPIPAGLDWQSLLDRDGEELETQYLHILRELGTKPGMLGQIYRKAQNKIQDPARLSHLIKNLIDKEEWSILDADVKGDAYEGLLDQRCRRRRLRGRAVLHASGPHPCHGQPASNPPRLTPW